MQHVIIMFITIINNIHLFNGYYHEKQEIDERDLCTGNNFLIY